MKITKIIKPKLPEQDKDLECFILLDKSQVDISEIEKRAKKEGYREQTARHITIMGDTAAEQMKKVISQYNKSTQKEFLRKIKSLFSEIDWSFKPKGILHIEKAKIIDKSTKKAIEKRKSYVRMIDMPGMEKFYNALNKLLNTDIPVQVPHITLFTKGELPNPKYYGTPIGSEEEFKKLNPKQITKG